MRPIHDYLTIHPQLRETRNGKILHERDLVEALLKLDLERFANVLKIDKRFDFDNAEFLYEHTYLRDLE